MERKRKSEAGVKEKKTPTKVRPIPRKHAGKVTEPWTIMEKLIAEVEQFAHLKLAIEDAFNTFQIDWANRPQPQQVA
jgi:hypothetical protein